jgi:hypothetical protein
MKFWPFCSRFNRTICFLFPHFKKKKKEFIYNHNKSILIRQVELLIEESYHFSRIKWGSALIKPKNKMEYSTEIQSSMSLRALGG